MGTRNAQSMARSCLTAALLACATPADAEFTLNFTQQLPGATIKDSIANTGCSNGVSTMGQHRTDLTCGSTDFLQEVIDTGSEKYYHVIVGDVDKDGFAQEYYIQATACGSQCWFTKKPIFGEAPLSASYGDTSRRLTSAFFPLGGPSFTGVGTGNPNRIHMRQINKDANMTLEFTKTFNAKKPRIFQEISDGGIVATFDADMRTISYSQSQAPVVVNTVKLYDPNGNPVPVGDFDMSRVQDSDVTAGRYTYTDGSSFLGSYGNYTYDADSFDPFAINWVTYCHPEENLDRGCVGGPGPNGNGPP